MVLCLSSQSCPPFPSLPGTYPTGTGSGPTTALCPGSSSSAGIPPSAGCTTFSPAALPSSLFREVPFLQNWGAPHTQTERGKSSSGFYSLLQRSKVLWGEFRRKHHSGVIRPRLSKHQWRRLRELCRFSCYQVPFTPPLGKPGLGHLFLPPPPFGMPLVRNFVRVMTKEKYFLT